MGMFNFHVYIVFGFPYGRSEPFKITIICHTTKYILVSQIYAAMIALGDTSWKPSDHRRLSKQRGRRMSTNGLPTEGTPTRPYTWDP